MCAFIFCHHLVKFIFNESHHEVLYIFVAKFINIYLWVYSYTVFLVVFVFGLILLIFFCFSQGIFLSFKTSRITFDVVIKKEFRSFGILTYISLICIIRTHGTFLRKINSACKFYFQNSPPWTQSHALEMEGSNYNEYIVAINFTLIFKIYGLC